VLLDRSVRELLSELSSPTPTPGGGSAAALASALGASLLLMVASLPRTRTGSTGERESLDRARAALAPLKDHLANAVDLDAEAYAGVVAARRLPKSSPSEQAVRADAMRGALIQSIDVPLAVMQHAASALEQAHAIAPRAARAAASDVGVAVLLLQAGFEGARLNVEANLKSVSAAPQVQDVETTVARLARRVADILAEIEPLLR
jgi:formiminotetrahydrofolate cyclodeaminase